eukprot:GEZU01024580.1.p2 GENE.GEZU01024580.1~~GEZU01024580.1.p2  ORF type:complete len:141 (-),score=28.59 GEZU01024580.1:110-532(-)
MIVDEERLEVPEYIPDAEALLSTALFSEVCKDLKGITDNVLISINGEHISFQGTSDLIKSNIVLKAPEVDLVCNREIAQKFNQRIIGIIGKTTTISDTVLLQMAKDAPLSALFGLDKNMGSFHFYVAPLIEDDGHTPEQE